MREIYEFEKELINCDTCDDKICHVRWKFQRWPEECGGLGACNRLNKAIEEFRRENGGQDERKSPEDGK